MRCSSPQDIHGEKVSDDAEEGDARHEEALDEVLEKRLLLDVLRRPRLPELARRIQSVLCFIVREHLSPH